MSSGKPPNIFPCCCCPPPVAAILCLYCQSGCSKATVAGALTFFPPDPATYTFRRVNMFGEALVDESTYEPEDGSGNGGATMVGGGTVITSAAGDATVITGVTDFGPDARVNGKVAFSNMHPERDPNDRKPVVRRSNSSKRNGSPERGSRSPQRTARGRAGTPLPEGMKNAPGVSAGTKKKMMESAGTAVPAEEPPPILRPSKPLFQMTPTELAKYKLACDKRDAADGVRYAFVPDPSVRPHDGGYLASITVQHGAGGAWGEDRAPRAPPSGGRRKMMVALEAIKLYNKKAGSYVAAVVARPSADGSSGKGGDGDVHGKVLIYSHGNATDVGGMHSLQLTLAHTLRITVVVYDYSGYGESSGKPLEHNTCSDIEVVYEHVTKVMKTHPDNVLLYGQSVGSGPSCYLAARKPAGGLILHSPFMSGMRVLTPSRLLGCLDIFPNIDRIKRVSCPVFIIHGMLDEEVDMHHGVSLYNAVKEDCRREPWWVPDRGHNDITNGTAKMNEYLRRLGAFIQGLEEDYEVHDPGAGGGGATPSHRKREQERANI
mmetsp:Transcript_34608/g.68127  ORF Transcript_34608/g.68127 Transcript_34608/m.68127 type:complete len:546 (+) Transcript_34608:318-1955(+)|eukprot:CAMPEP_0194336880 /NCGR_PEP_ID=MMETSP0171-20130528/74487_1 /TAXON_ID=218684 /ORGANISM="Corethron pennatum, Strain L29A3" /LENGTH=545 /DNA_ID=CAMNT_0039100463 /DNA_START=273 /DNA_END=1910 /DNA_ORIENTATION=+